MRAAMFVLALAAIMGAGTAQARDTELNLNIDAVMRDGEITSKLGKDVAFYFSGQPTPKVSKTLGDFVTNRKTNSFGRPDDAACRWAMLAALIHLQERARELGGNAVVNVVSYYKKNATASATDYVCHAGNFVAGVALKGTVAVVGR
jgi:threonine dehydrogenase-like Zn-dependent dehydrogenase